MLQIMNGGETYRQLIQTSKAFSSWYVTEDGSSIKQSVRPPPPVWIQRTHWTTTVSCINVTQPKGRARFCICTSPLTTGLDLSNMEAHYTVMDRSLVETEVSPTGNRRSVWELNMIAVSNPCVVIKHWHQPATWSRAYGAGNEP
jgi:hypothetical protein